MELRQLRYFVAVAEELHFGRAARRLHIAQPALSQQIQRLERNLGVLLLARTRRSVALTEAGRALLAEARRTLVAASAAERAAHRAARGEVGRLRVGYVDLATYLVLPGVVRAYRERYPAVELALTELHREPQREALARGDLDVGFFTLREGDGDFEGEQLAEDTLVAVLPEGHVLAARPAVPLEALSGEGWMLFPRELRTQYVELVFELCGRAGFVPRVVQEASQLHTLSALVSAGLGVTLLPESVARVPRAGVSYRPLTEPGPGLALHIVWRRGDVSAAATRLVEIAGEFGARERRPASGTVGLATGGRAAEVN